MMSYAHLILFEKVIDLIYGEYDPSAVSREEQEKYTDDFRERMIRWKEDESYRTILGPLQPAHIFSRMARVPVSTVNTIIQDLDLTLPEQIDLTEFSLDELEDQEANDLLSLSKGEDLLNALARVENEKYPKSAFEFVDLSDASVSGEESVSNVIAAVSYLEGLIDKLKSGQVHSMTLVALLKDGQASLWIPGAFPDDAVETLYDPIIEKLKNGSPMNTSN